MVAVAAATSSFQRWWDLHPSFVVLTVVPLTSRGSRSPLDLTLRRLDVLGTNQYLQQIPFLLRVSRISFCCLRLRTLIDIKIELGVDGARSPEGKRDDVRLASGQRTVKIQLVLMDRMPAAHGMPW